LHGWIARALQLDPRQGFTSATEAQVALEDALADDSGFVAAPVALETFLSRYIAAMLEPVGPVGVAPLPVVPVVTPAPPPAPSVPPVVSAPVALIIPEPVAAEPIRIVPPVAPPAPAPAPAPTAPVASPLPPAAQVASPSAPSAASAPRDITELLKDFDIPAADLKPELVLPPPDRPRFAGWLRIAVIALVGVAVIEGIVIGTRSLRQPAAPTLGTLSLQTNPPGVAVFVDGVARGNTPARLSLSAGSHIVELRGRGVPRVIPVSVTAGAEASQYLELPETPSSGSLLVQSDPAGARVTVDGVDHGAAPVSVADLAPGEHEVVLQGEGGAPVKQRVVIQAGVTSSVLAPVATNTGPVSGWLSVKAPVAIEIRQSGRLIGTTDSDRIMMAAGRHDIELVNDTLGYDVKRTIQVMAGKTASINIEMPMGVINLNAAPWAEVWIDGRRAGETPIGNLPITIGPHEIVFRHPQLGEKRQAVSVTLKAPVRLSVDMK
jgi:hypothetical protein